MVRVTVEADTVEELQEALRSLGSVSSSPPALINAVGDEESPPPEPAGESPPGMEHWRTDEIKMLWARLRDETRYILGCIADAGEDGGYFRERGDLFDHLETKYGIKVQRGKGFGGILSSYGFSTKALGFRGVKERLYTTDERGYSMRKEYALVVLDLFEKWLEKNPPKC